MLHDSRLSDLSGLGLPGAETKGGDLSARVELERGREGHCDCFCEVDEWMKEKEKEGNAIATEQNS